MRCLIAFTIFAAITGCAQKPAGPPPKIESPAICFSKPQCDAMWSEAMTQAQNLSGMRIQTATDTFLQTFNPVGFGRMSATARKMPQPNGSTAIEATFSCRTCGNLAYDAVNLFTANVKAAGSSFGPVNAGVAAPAPVSGPALDKKAWQDQQLKKLQESDVSYEEYQVRYKKIMGE